jgi:DNA-binding transcriptional LysR family regulator
MSNKLNSNHLLEYVDYLEAIEKSGSFAAAARRLSVSQPALSQAVSRIENQVKFTLFQRNFKGAVLTLEGKRLLEELNHCKMKISETCTRLRIQSTKQKNVLKIVTKPLLLNTLIPQLIPIISSIEPDFKIKLLVNFYNNEIDEMIATGAADMALIPLIKSDRTGYRQFSDHKLVTETFNFWSQPEDNQNTDQIFILNNGLFSDKISFESLMKMLSKEKFQVQPLPDYSSIVSMAVLGQGMGLVPKSFATKTNLKAYVGSNQFLNTLTSKLGFTIGFRSLDDAREASRKRIKLIKSICTQAHASEQFKTHFN